MRHREANSRAMYCVDPKNGIYLTQKNETGGVLYPVHVQKSSCINDCDNPNCAELHKVLRAGNNPGATCRHLARRPVAFEGHAPVKAVSFDEMVVNTLMTEHQNRICQEKNDVAANDGVPLCVPLFYNEKGYKTTWFFFSVYTGVVDNWCKLKRAVVSFNVTTGKWHCPCHTKKTKCDHKLIAATWVCQERPQLLGMCDHDNALIIDDIEFEISQTVEADSTPAQSDIQIRKMSEYLHKAKKIPTLDDIPMQYKNSTNEFANLRKFVPDDIYCPYCKDTGVELSQEILVTRASVYGVTGKKEGMTLQIFIKA